MGAGIVPSIWGEWRRRVCGMYRAWALARNMQLSEVPANGAKEEASLLLISGFGAYRALSREAGLHVLEAPNEEKTVDRITARVRVAAAPLGDIPQNKLHAALTAALSRGAPPTSVIRRYRNGGSPLVRDMSAGWRTGRLDAVLRGDFDLFGVVQS